MAPFCAELITWINFKCNPWTCLHVINKFHSTILRLKFKIKKINHMLYNCFKILKYIHFIHTYWIYWIISIPMAVSSLLAKNKNKLREIILLLTITSFWYNFLLIQICKVEKRFRIIFSSLFLILLVTIHKYYYCCIWWGTEQKEKQYKIITFLNFMSRKFKFK